jgi:hypothetical protein
LLTLPVRDVATSSAGDLTSVTAAWAEYLGTDLPLLLVSDTQRARRLLMAAFGIESKEPVGIPVNTRRPLSEAVKRSGGTPRFIELDAALHFDPETPGFDEPRLLWAQPVGGMAPPPAPGDRTMFVDYGFTLPAPLMDGGRELAGAATLWGLHLMDLSTGRAAKDGALIAFSDPTLYAVASALLTPEDEPDLNAAMAQLNRLAGEDGIAARQLRVLDAVRVGMESGAGMPMMTQQGICALPFGMAVRIPEEADPATFISYVRNENLALDWLPEIQPMFYVSYQVTRDRERTFGSAANLSRWIFSPLGPDMDGDDDEIVHAVLGVLKAAEYTGVRWYTDPARARWYGDLMFEWYGPDHDAYRVAFEAEAANEVLVGD